MFNLQDQKYIKLLDLNAQIYTESEFKCKHIHLDSKSDEKVFMVAFRTIPEDSTGVAHILEHTALCGSKKYPVRDPFFMMIRRSLNTFMNVFNDLLIIIKNGSLTGYFFDPHKAVCSKICATPVESSGIVLKATINTFSSLLESK